MAALRYLFLCDQGINRSTVSAALAQKLADANGLKIQMFPGAIRDRLNYIIISPNDNRFKQELTDYLSSYQRILVMDREIMDQLLNLGIERAKLRCLNVPDIYDIRKPEEKKALEDYVGKGLIFYLMPDM